MTISFDAATSLLIYLVVLSLAALLIQLAQNEGMSRLKKRTLLIAGLMLPALLGGLRHNVGADYHSYEAKMEAALNMGMFEFSNYFSIEPSVWILGRLSHTVFDSGVLFFFATSLLVPLFFYLGLKRFGVKKVGLVMLLILLVIFPQSLSGVRQGVAIALSFYAMSFIPDRKFWPFLVVILVASTLFHATALALLLIYPLYHWIVRPETNDKTFLRKIATVILASLALLPVGLLTVRYIPFLDKYANYYGRFFEEFAHLMGTHNILPELFAVLFMVVFFKKIVSNSETGRFAFLMTSLMATVTCLGLFMPLAGRFADYFMPVFLMAFASLPTIFTSIRHKRIATIFIVCWAVAFFIGAFFIKGSGMIFPYQLTLMGTMSGLI